MPTQPAVRLQMEPNAHYDGSKFTLWSLLASQKVCITRPGMTSSAHGRAKVRASPATWRNWKAEAHFGKGRRRPGLRPWGRGYGTSSTAGSAGGRPAGSRFQPEGSPDRCCSPELGPRQQCLKKLSASRALRLMRVPCFGGFGLPQRHVAVNG